MAKKQLRKKKKNSLDSKDKTPFYKRWWFIAIIVFLVIGALGSEDDTSDISTEETPESSTVNDDTLENEAEDDTTNTEEVAEVTGAEEEPATDFDNVFEEKATDVFGDNLQNVFVDEAGEATEHYVGITSNLSGGWNEQTMRDSFYRNVVEVLSTIENEEFDRIVFDASAEMVDQYGNTKEMKVLTVNLTKETVDKINFDNFIADNLIDIADAVFIHPAFQD